jgi:putative transposase
MSRPWRIEYPGAAYHVMSRGNRGQDIFLDSDDRRTFLATVENSVNRFNLHIFAFCLMSNHYHMFIRTPEGNLSRAMHWINATYTRRFHNRHKSYGHLFQGRYKSVIVLDEAHWLWLSAYIHLNPVRSGIVEYPYQYQWSSYRDYTRAKAQFPWLKAEDVRAQFGPDKSTCRRNYRRHVMELLGRKPSFWDNIRNALFLGTIDQWEDMKRTHPPRGDRRTVKEYRSISRHELNFEKELSRVAEAFGVSKQDIMAGRRINSARIATYYHLVENCGQSITKTAELMGVSMMAVSMGLNRFKNLIQKNNKLRKKMNEINFNV